MTKTAAQKRATNKWNKANMTSLAVSLRKEEAERIKTACYARGTNPSAIMRKALDEFMESYRQQSESNNTSDNN